MTPANVTLLGGQTQQFTVAAVDQFGKPISSAWYWQVNGVVGSAPRAVHGRGGVAARPDQVLGQQ